MTEPREDLDAIRQRVNWLVGEIGAERRKAGDLTSARDTKIKAIHDEDDPIIRQQAKRADTLENELTTLVEEWLDQLAMPGTATIRVDNGEVSRHRGQEALEISDEAALVRSIRRRRLVSKLLRRKVTYSVDKNALKKRADLKRFPGVRLVREVSWHIRPGRTPGQTFTKPAKPRPTD